MAVGEQRRPEARPQRDHQFDAFAANRCHPLHCRIVRHANRFLPSPGKDFLQFEPDPLRVKIVSGQRRSMFHHARKANRNTIEVPERVLEHVQYVQYGSRGGRIRGIGSLPLRDGFSRGIEKLTLNPGSPDIDRKRGDPFRMWRHTVTLAEWRWWWFSATFAFCFVPSLSGPLTV